MITKKVYIPASGVYSVEESGEPFNPEVGKVTLADSSDGSDPEKSTSEPSELVGKSPHLERFLDVAALANLSHVTKSKDDDKWHARGDPTEIAINVFASRFGWNRTKMTTGDSAQWKSLLEFPFDSDVKKMSVILEDNKTQKKHVFTKGAVERILQHCSHFHQTNEGDATEMTDEHRQGVLDKMEEFATYGLRVLALASRAAPEDLDYDQEIDRNKIEIGLTFRGLVGIYDPPRAESAGAVRECRGAGIEVHMLTGDHPETARAIAIEVGILPSKKRMDNLPKDVAQSLVMTASAFDKLSEEEIDALPQLPLVVARCAPSTKVRMIEALHRRKKFAAMVSLRDQWRANPTLLTIVSRPVTA